MKKTINALLAALGSIPLLAPVLEAAEFTYTESDSSGSNIALGYPAPEPQATTEAGAWFREYAYMHAVHQSLALDHDFISAHVVGETWKNADIWAYRFGDADDITVDGTPEGSVLINGGIHAREWQAQEATTGLMEYLAANANDGGIVQYLVENLNIVIIPVHNIDGFRQTQTYWNKVTSSEAQPRDGRMRRKNLHAPGNTKVDDSLGTTGDNLYGIDLNRNMKHGFGENDGSSDSFTSLVYRGTAPASEPESAALLAARNLAPNLRFYEDTHSFSQLMYVPQIGDPERDRQARDLAQLMSNAVGGRYAVSPDPVGADIGTTADYFASEHKVPSWTLELEPTYFRGGTQYGGIGVSHDGFILPAAEVPRLRDEYNAMHRDVFYDRTGPAHLKEVLISDASTGSVVYHARWSRSGDSRSINVLVDDNLVTGASYDLWLHFSKPVQQDSGNPEIDILSSDGKDSAIAARSNGTWPAAAGGPPDGYRQYAGDTYRERIDIDNVSTTGGDRWMLVFASGDAVGNGLDAEPATVAGFADGKWTGHESLPLPEPGDNPGGGQDCNFAVRIGDNATTSAFDRTACRDYLEQFQDDRNSVAPISPPSTGGGGGLAWLAMALVVFRLVRYRMQ